MSDLKEGICAEAFWLNREQCCWSVSKTDANDEYCQQVGDIVCWKSATVNRVGEISSVCWTLGTVRKC
jgi:hypothetical protein